MPAKKRCQAKVLVTSPPLPSASQQAVPTHPSSPGQEKRERELKDLPATEASKTEIRCEKAAVRVVGECGYCGGSFCAGHRLPEQHFCSNLQACRDAAYSLNKAKLESEKTVARKVGEV